MPEMGEAEAMLYAAANPYDQAVFAWVVGVGVTLLFLFLLYHARAAIYSALYAIIWWPWITVYRLHRKWTTWLVRREHAMKRSREQKLKEEAASHLIAWLMERVHQGTMSLQDSYDLQKTLARTMAMPTLMPIYEPTFVKEAIKARRAMNGSNKAPVPFPDLDRRGKRRTALHGTPK